MAEIYELDRTYGKDVNICLKPGMAWILYSDNGPSGPCGQDMRTTGPHTAFHIFPNEQAMRQALEAGVGRNKISGHVDYGVVDEWTAASVFQVVIYGEEWEEVSDDQR